MTDLETKFNDLLRKLNIPLHAIWCPDPKSEQRAKIVPDLGLLLIFDEDEEEAMRSLFHEVFEYGIRGLA